MFIHITFKDGSNPYVRFNLNKKEFEKEKQKWGQNYILSEVKDIVTGVFYEAKVKENK